MMAGTHGTLAITSTSGACSRTASEGWLDRLARQMTSTAFSGSCLCGAVRFSVRMPTKWVAHCHCTICRRAHGAPFVTWAGYESGQFALEPGAHEPRWYESSPGARRASCPACGTPMFFASDRWPGEIHVARALLPDGLDMEPSAHVFFDSHVPWLSVADDLPRKAGLSPAGPAPA